MAYNNGFPMTYQQMYPQYVPSSFQPQMMQQQPQMTQPVNDTGILWVQGEAGAKSWAVAEEVMMVLTMALMMVAMTAVMMRLMTILIAEVVMQEVVIPAGIIEDTVVQWINNA